MVLFAEERRRKLLAKLAKLDSKHRHRKLKESLHEGTGAWFISCPEYKQWQAALQSSVLCCYGIPGCGKSVLVSSVIDSFNATGTFVFYYCDYADKRTLEPSNVFASLAKQALEHVQILPETLASEIEQAEHDGEKLANPTEALIILQKSLDLVTSPVFLAVDGLDEATESSQILIYKNLKQLVENSGLPVKLLITGRDELGLLLMLDLSIPFARIPLSSTVISLDIENYVRASTRRRISDGLLVIGDPDLEELIIDELVKGAKGMFLWVEFQLHDLCEPESDHGIRIVLQNLPRSLGETYQRLLNKIEGAERKDIIKRMFKWIVCAREPIYLDGLREAVAFTLDDLSYDPRKLPTDLNRLIRACGNLVVVKETQIVQLAHYTVQQYLLQLGDSPFQFTIKDANVMAGEFCVTYLSFSNFESQITRYADNKNTNMLALGKIASRGPMLSPDYSAQKIVHVWNTFRNSRSITPSIDMTRFVPPRRKAGQPDSFDFLAYVVAHWLWHTRSFDVNDDAIMEMSTRRRRLFVDLALKKQLLFDFRPWGGPTFDFREASSISLLGWALMADHGYLIQVTSASTVLLSSFDAWVATCENYEWTNGITHDLSRLDLDYDHSSFTSDSPDLVWLFSRLVRACQNGHIDAIKKVEFGNTGGPHFVPMFQYLVAAAAANGRLQVVQFLWQEVKMYLHSLNKLVVVSGLSKRHALSAIEHAAISGHSHVVSYLADHGAHAEIIFSIPGLFQKFFDEAISNDAGQIVESLLTLRSFNSNIGDDTESFHVSDQYFSDSLVNAIAAGHTEIVRTLLKNGIDPNTPNQAGSTPLIEAIRHSRDSIVSLLLEYCCFLGNDCGGMPLTIAACLGNLRIVRELIIHGGPIFGEFESENKMFLPYGVETFIGDSAGDLDVSLCYMVRLPPTPLYLACYHGHLNVVELLLSYGAEANYPSPVTVINLQQRKASSAKIDYSMYQLPDNLNAVLYGSFGKERAASDKTSWELPISAAIAGGHVDIMNTLVSSGALWPKEFDCLYGSCLGTLDSQLETLASRIHQGVQEYVAHGPSKSRKLMTFIII